MEKIEHIGIAVKDIEKSNELFASLFGKPHYKMEEVLPENEQSNLKQEDQTSKKSEVIEK